MGIDRTILEFDRALRTLALPARSRRKHPGSDLPLAQLSEVERSDVIGLMRVNHSGEICAQALYQGQALTSRDPMVRKALEAAADEETEHLAWTEQRITELGGRKSLLNPVWYMGSLSIGVFAGLIGDKWNLGFLAETEHQVESHLTAHLARLPIEDIRSRAIVSQMRDDEIKHAQMACVHGAVDLPLSLRKLMKATAKVLTTLAYRL